ncbi:hypothetical protein [[Eubacterium] cellulosolvens]
MGRDYYLLIISEKKDFIPSNVKICKIIEYIEKNNIINLNTGAAYREYRITFHFLEKKPPFEHIEFETWIECKRKMLSLLKDENNIKNISFIIETTRFYNNIFLRYKKYLSGDSVGTICFGIKDPPREYWYGDNKKGETYFRIETFFRPGPSNLDSEKKFITALKKDKDFKKIFKDFEDILGTKLKIESHWSW